MRKLPAAAQEERRRQVIGLRERGLSYEAIAAQVGLSRTGVFNICQRFARAGLAGVASQRRGPAPGHGRVLATEQETAIRALICAPTPDELGLPVALWQRAAVQALIRQRCGVRLAVRTVGKFWRAGGSPPRSRCGAPTSRTRSRCSTGCSRTIWRSWRRPTARAVRFSGAMRLGCARMMCVAALRPPAATRRWSGFATSGPS